MRQLRSSKVTHQRTMRYAWPWHAGSCTARHSATASSPQPLRLCMTPASHRRLPQPRTPAPASMLGGHQRYKAVGWTATDRWVQTSVTPTQYTTFRHDSAIAQGCISSSYHRDVWTCWMRRFCQQAKQGKKCVTARFSLLLIHEVQPAWGTLLPGAGLLCASRMTERD